MSTHPGARLIRRVLNWDLDPADVLRLVRLDAHPVALLGSWAGGSDIIASEPTQVRSPPQSLGDVMDHSFPDVDDQDISELGSTGFGGGWLGYAGFGLATALLPAPPAPGPRRRLPAWWFGWYDHVLRRDQATRTWTFEALWTPARSEDLERRFADLSTRPERGDASRRSYSTGEFELIPSAMEHRAAIQRAIEYIRSGDVFQANICLQLEAPFSGDPLDAFCQTAALLQPPYAAFLRVPGGEVASMSPELFLQRIGNTVVTRPIKGTRFRPANPADAAVQREILLRSDKDRAENVMIVDLMRNDLNRVCSAGSVEVPRLVSAEAHPGVWHLVSDVRGRLRPGASDADLISATFPPGSVTGAPKTRAVEIIHEVEATPREVYTGAIGYRSPVAGLALNVAIRTFEFHQGRVWLGAGGGITVRSDVDDEYRESLLKAAPLIAALGAHINERDESPGAARLPDAAYSTPSMRPRPARGVFTSVSIDRGQAHDLDAHLTRLQASTWLLYGKRLPVSVRSDLTAVLRAYPSGRLRISAKPLGGPLHVTMEVVAMAPKPSSVSLHPFTVPGGFGSHKWQDRRMITALAAGLGTNEHLLIQDRDGHILETDRANVFAVIDGVLHTPPADDRALPGVTRAAVLRLAKKAGISARESTLSLPELRGADEVFVTNSTYGITPVHSVAGSQTAPTPGAHTARLSDLLNSRRTGWSNAAPAALHANSTGINRSRSLNRPVIVLIDNYDSFTYNLADLLLEQRCQVEVIHNDEVTADAVAAFAPNGILISPGPCSPAEAGISIDTVRICAATTPVLGVCLGHQAIAAAFGGNIVPAVQPTHGQASAITHDARGVLAGLPQLFLAARYHSLLVDDKTLPASLEVTARASGGLLMGIRHRQYSAEGIQFHPESILTKHGPALIRNFARTAELQWGRGPRGVIPKERANS